MRRYLIPLFARFVNATTRFVDALCRLVFLPPLATRLLQLLLPLEEHSVLKAAEKATGLRDYGEGNFLPPLRMLLKGLEEEARLSAFGRILIWNDLQRLLRYRLQLEDTRKRHPEIEEEKIEAPVFILGLPRTGTTLLFNLLSLDSSLFRSPLTWEVHHMYPPPDATSYSTDKRIGETEAFIESVSALLPTFQAVHPVEATAPQECMGLMMYDFTSFAFPTIHFNLPTYWNWLLTSDITPTYQFMRWQLQYLQWQGPKAKHWLLKCPAHLFSLRSLVKAFPDARLIFTHRNPLTVMASSHSLFKGIRSIHSEQVDKAEISNTWVPGCAQGLAGMMELRGMGRKGEKGGAPATNGKSAADVAPSATNGGSSASGETDVLTWQPSQAMDVRYSDFVADPMAMVRRIYRDLLKRQLDGDVADKMQAYLAANSKEKRPRHHYSWEDTMLDKEEERERFKFYIDAFGLDTEG